MKDNNLDYSDVLKSVAADGCLGKSERQLNLLKYLLEQTQSGKGRYVKQYSIALDVIGRPDSFDQTTDSIVRVEMHRLRKNLRQYSSRSKEYSINIPTGTYQVSVKPLEKDKTHNLFFSRLKIRKILSVVLIFMFGLAIQPLLKFKKDGALITTSIACSIALPNLSVKEHHNTGSEEIFIQNFIVDVANQYTNFNYVDKPSNCAHAETPHYEIGYIFHPMSKSSIVIMISELRSGDRIYFQTVSETSENSSQITLTDETARRLSQALKPYGSVSRDAIKRHWSSIDSKRNYQCLIGMYDYYGTETNQDYLDVHSCLVKAVSERQDVLDLNGGLAASFLEQALGYKKSTVSDPYKTAQLILEKHPNDWIDSVELILAKMMYEANRPDFSVDRFRGIVSRSAERYDQNPQVLLTSSLYMGYWIGDWETAKKWSDRTKQIHSDRDHSVYFIDAGYAFQSGNFTEAANSCEKAYSELSLLANVIVNACARLMENHALINQTENNLNSFDLATNDARVNYIKTKGFEPRIRAQLISTYSSAASY